MEHPFSGEIRRVEGATRRLVERICAHVPGCVRGLPMPAIRRRRWPPPNRALLPVRHPFDRVHDALVARAATEVAAQPPCDLASRRRGVALQQRRGRHDHPRRAEPALDGVGCGKRLLQGVRALCAAQPFDRQDAPSGRLARGRPARAHRLPVDHDDAGPARAVVAAFLRPGQPEALAEKLQQPPAGRGINAARGAVHLQVHARSLDHLAIMAERRAPSVHSARARRGSAPGCEATLGEEQAREPGDQEQDQRLVRSLVRVGPRCSCRLGGGIRSGASSGDRRLRAVRLAADPACWLRGGRRPGNGRCRRRKRGRGRGRGRGRCSRRGGLGRPRGGQSSRRCGGCRRRRRSCGWCRGRRCGGGGASRSAQASRSARASRSAQAKPSAQASAAEQPWAPRIRP